MKKTRRVSDLVTEAKAACDRMSPERRLHVNASVSERFPPDVVQLIEEMAPMPNDAGQVLTQLVADLRSAIRVGFALALVRYARELRANKEAMAILNARVTGGSKGRQSQSRAKADRADRIRLMLNQGIEPRDIARDVGCSISTVYRALTPTTSKPAKRSRSPRRR